MPIATVDLVVDKAYLIVRFAPARRPDPKYPDLLYADRSAALPAGLGDFPEVTQRGPQAVCLRLMKDAQGRADVLNMMVAADWLRDEGWEVVPRGWCREVFDRVHGTAAG
jgi:hypothetical protein